jgi:hypothetical protein
MVSGLKRFRRRSAAVPLMLPRENFLAASLHEIRPFSTVGAPDENCRGELKHPALFAFAAAIRFSAGRAAFNSRGG